MKKHNKKNANYVMYGFCLADPDDVGYLATIPNDVECENVICDDIKEAKLFPSANVNGITGFGTPEQWLKFVNDEFKDIYGEGAWKFHLVKTCR